MTSADFVSALPEPDLSVIVLAWNEAANVEPTMAELLDTLRALDVTWEMVLVDDGSSDETGALFDAWALREGPALQARGCTIRVVHHEQNLGLGGGYRTGLCEARGRFLTFFPADGQFPARIIPAFLARMPSLDLVLGYLPARTDGFRARALSAAERLLYRALFGYMPRFQGIFMLRKSVLRSLPLRSTGRGWGIVMELILRAHRAGLRIESIPTELRPRLSGQSKVANPRTIVANLKQLVALRWLLR